MLSLLALTNELKGQNNFVSSGGVDTLKSGSIEFSIGQVFYSHFFESTIIEEQGLQHPEFKSVVGNKLNISEEFKILPNPFINKIEIQNSNFELSKLEYNLYSSAGLEIDNGKLDLFESNVLNFEFLGLARGSYFIKLKFNNDRIAIIKLIKQ